MVNSLKEIINKIEQFCTVTGIPEFQADDFSKFTSSDHRYPLIWVTPINFVLVNGQATYGLDIAVMDVVYDTNDLMQVLSDLTIILAELQTYIDDDSENCNYFASINSSFEPFYRGIDNVCGWKGRIDFKTSFQARVSDIRM